MAYSVHKIAAVSDDAHTNKSKGWRGVSEVKDT